MKHFLTDYERSMRDDLRALENHVRALNSHLEKANGYAPAEPILRTDHEAVRLSREKCLARVINWGYFRSEFALERRLLQGRSYLVVVTSDGLELGVSIDALKAMKANSGKDVAVQVNSLSHKGVGEVMFYRQMVFLPRVFFENIRPFDDDILTIL